MALAQQSPVMKNGQIVPGVQNATGLLVLPELSVFLEKRDYRSGLVPLITRLADAPDEWSSETICRGEIRLTNVALCMLGGSAPSWLVGSIPSEAFTGGFMARFLFVVSEGSAVPVPRPPHYDKVLQQKLITGLKDFNRVRGEIVVDDEAEEYFSTWYRAFYYRRSVDEKRAAYQERKHDHLMRISMVLAVSESRTIISLEDLKRAIGYLDYIEEGMFSLFGEIERGQSAVGSVLQTVLTLIKKSGGITHSDLLRYTISKGISASMVTEAIDSLRGGNFIALASTKVENRPTTYYTYLGESERKKEETNGNKE